MSFLMSETTHNGWRYLTCTLNESACMCVCVCVCAGSRVLKSDTVVALKCDTKVHNRSKDHCSPQIWCILLRQRQSPFPRYSRGCCTYYRGNTVNSKPITAILPWISIPSRGNTADTAVIPRIPLPCHSFTAKLLAPKCVHDFTAHLTFSNLTLKIKWATFLRRGFSIWMLWCIRLFCSAPLYISAPAGWSTDLALPPVSIFNKKLSWCWQQARRV